MDSEIKRNFLLMGKTGDGKSSTGNTLLQRKYFKVSASATSVTKVVDHSFERLDKYIIHVVDGPGLRDTELNQITGNEKLDANAAKAEEFEQRAKELEAYKTNMETALAMCYGGVDAFLLVIRFGSRFTKENIETVESLETIFGPDYMNNLVVIMTNGDSFKRSMEDDCRDNFNFHDWCQSQKGALKELYDKCRGRFVLFNNVETGESKRRQQVLELLKIVDSIRTDKDCYDAECFKRASAEREKLIVNLRAPQLKFNIQKKISLLSGDIDKMDQDKQPLQREKDNVEKQILDLKKEIINQDKGAGVLQDMSELVDKLHQNLNNVMELKELARKLEKLRTEAKLWAALGSVTTVTGGLLCLLNPAIGATVAAIGYTTSCSFLVNLASDQTGLNREKAAREEKIKANDKFIKRYLN